MSNRQAGLILLAVFFLIAATGLIGGCENHDGDSMALTADDCAPEDARCYY